MRRMHLFEFTDQPWLPRVLRDGATAYLVTSYRMLRALTRRWAEIIAAGTPAGGACEILDLCSGAGGPVPLVVDDLEKLGYRVKATLTDLYPNAQFPARANITWLARPVDAARVPTNLTGVRTLFAGFHHFRPEEAKAILKDAFDQRRAICVFEAGARTPAALLTMIGVPIGVLVLMPFARPFRWTYLLVTYLIPVLPLLILWDGLVSTLRFYSSDELRELTQDLVAGDYEWNIGEITIGKAIRNLPYLTGRPAPSPTAIR